MDFRGNALVPENKNSGERQDTDSTIWNAKELERYGEPPESDP